MVETNEIESLLVPLTSIITRVPTSWKSAFHLQLYRPHSGLTLGLTQSSELVVLGVLFRLDSQCIDYYSFVQKFRSAFLPQKVSSHAKTNWMYNIFYNSVSKMISIKLVSVLYFQKCVQSIVHTVKFDQETSSVW